MDSSISSTPENQDQVAQREAPVKDNTEPRQFLSAKTLAMVREHGTLFSLVFRTPIDARDREESFDL